MHLSTVTLRYRPGHPPTPVVAGSRTLLPTEPCAGTGQLTEGPPLCTLHTRERLLIETKLSQAAST